MNLSKVEVVICVKDSWDYIKDAINSVLDQTYANISCTIVDDGSISEPPEYLNKYLRRVKYLKNRKNLGASASRNIGINSSDAEYFVTLDDDAILEKQWISTLISFMRKSKKIGICTGKIIKRDEENKLLSAGGAIKTWLKTYDIGYGGSPDLFNRSYEILYACSASMMIRKEAYDAVNGFDELLFWGSDDSDFGWRIKLAGYKNYFIPDVISWHEEGATSKNFGHWRGYLLLRHYLRQMAKNCQLITLIRKIPIVATYIFIYMFSSPINFINTIKAIIWNIKVLPSTLKERRYIYNIRKIDDTDILKIGKFAHSKYFLKYSFWSRLWRFVKSLHSHQL